MSKINIDNISQQNGEIPVINLDNRNKVTKLLQKYALFIVLGVLFWISLYAYSLSISNEDKAVIKLKNNIQNRHNANKNSLDIIKREQNLINERNKLNDKDKETLEKIVNKFDIIGLFVPRTYAHDGDLFKVSRGEVIQFKVTNKDLDSILKWIGGRTHRVNVYEKQVKILKDLGYSKTRILDLLAFRTMECNEPNGQCKSSADIGPFQINQVHTENYNKSLKLYDKPTELFTYQAKVANDLLDTYEREYCGEKHFKAIGKEYNNKERFKCYARCYNGGPNRVGYANRAYPQREIVKHFYNDTF